MKNKIQINSVFGRLLFEYETENNTIKKTVEYANLRDANLIDANLIDADLRGADLRGAYLIDANLRGANLSGADLSGAIKTPMFCKWSFGITDNKIHIGCERRTIKEWDLFFNSTDIIETKRDTQEFKKIEAVYNGLKAYYQTLNK